jgi:hypothetical protein
MVPMTRIERVASPLPRECSTTEPHGPVDDEVVVFVVDVVTDDLCLVERVKGIEPSS